MSGANDLRYKRYQLFFHSRSGLVLTSLILGLIATLGYAPYGLWVVTLVCLAFEFFFVATLKTKKQVFFSLLCFFTALNTMTLEWLNYVMTDFGNLPGIVSFFIELIFAIYLSLFHAALGTLAYALALRKLSSQAATAAPAEASATTPATTVATSSAAATSYAAPDTALANASNADATSATASNADKAGASTNSHASDDAEEEHDYEDDDDYEVEMPPRGMAALTQPVEKQTKATEAVAQPMDVALTTKANAAVNETLLARKSERDDAVTVDNEDDEEDEVELPPRGLAALSTPSAVSTSSTPSTNGTSSTSSKHSTTATTSQAEKEQAAAKADAKADANTSWDKTSAKAEEKYRGNKAEDQAGIRAEELAEEQTAWAEASAEAMQSRLGQKLLFPVLSLKGQAYRFYKNSMLLCFLPVAMLLADLIIGTLFTGFPWMYVGYTTIDSPFASYAPFVGVRGISLIIFICAGALALTIERRYLYLPVAGFLFALGIFGMGIRFTDPMPPVVMAGVQGNIPQAIKWDPRQTYPTIDKYLNLTTPLFGSNDLIIWPESALPVFFQQIEPLLADINHYAYEHKSPLLLGLQRLNQQRQGYNSLYLIGQQAELHSAQIYDKRNLVPFGEAVPLEKWTRSLGSIFNLPMSSFTPGEDKQYPFHLASHDLYFLPVICYESIFPESLRNLNNENINGIIMVSNDSWFGTSRGPAEHLAIARMRALELQKPMMRVTNSGITAYIDDLGKVQKQLPSNVDGVLQVNFTPTVGMTPWARLGNIPLIIASMLLIVIGFVLRNREQDLHQQKLAELIRP